MKKTLGLLMIAGTTAAVCGVGKAKVSEAPAPKSDYVSPEFRVAAPDGGSVYVTSATGAHVSRPRSRTRRNGRDASSAYL